MIWNLQCAIALLYQIFNVESFSPDRSNFDSYGLKIALNDVMLVETYGIINTFFVQFAPYNYTNGTLQCFIEYGSDHYIYSVAVGVRQRADNFTYFFVAGELILESNTNGTNRTFVGIWINRDNSSVLSYVNNGESLSCDYFQPDYFQYISNYSHQEYFIMAVEPSGQYAIGIASDFIFFYKPFSNEDIQIKNSEKIWPNKVKFQPIAADASHSFTIVAGLTANSTSFRLQAIPTVFLLWNNNLTVLSSWFYVPVNNSWQSRLTYRNVNLWSEKFMMSVKINQFDTTRVLIGMPFLNTVFLFVVENGGTTLKLVNSIVSGNYVGFGKALTWLSDSRVAILDSIYSSDFSKWYSSKVRIFSNFTNTTSLSSSMKIIPNAQQSVPSTVDKEWLQIVSSSESLAILDVNGLVLMLLSAPPGYYASTNTNNLLISAGVLFISQSLICMPGMYKPESGIDPCALCLSGSYNPGNQAFKTCLNCSPTSFCPLGATYETDSNMKISYSQAVAYPRSPETDVFEDILLANVLNIGSSLDCILVSPLFWTIIVTGAAIIVVLALFIVNHIFQPCDSKKLQQRIKRTFRKTDLIGEGELWIGGLASIAIVVMSIMAYYFAINFLNQYPSEEVAPSTFTCDKTIRNAKFQSGLQPLAVPLSDNEQTIFKMLNQQNFTFQLELINTATTCSVLFISQLVEGSSTPNTLVSCNSSNGILKATFPLSSRKVTILIQIDDVIPIGALRVGISGPNIQNASNTLQKLNFSNVFAGLSISETMSQKAAISMFLTKVINETESLSGEASQFSGIWYPTFSTNLKQMFVTADEYITYSNSSETVITVDISETTYYIKNVQSPIAKQPEIIFRTLLFVFLCLEIFTMIFLLIRLLIIPILNSLTKLFVYYCGNLKKTAL